MGDERTGGDAPRGLEIRAGGRSRREHSAEEHTPQPSPEDLATRSTQEGPPLAVEEGAGADPDASGPPDAAGPVPAEDTVGPGTTSDPGPTSGPRPGTAPTAAGREPVEVAEPGPATNRDATAQDGADGRDSAAARLAGLAAARQRRVSSAGAMIGLLLALLGFTFAVQVKSNSGETALASARQEDLVRILSDLESREQRLRSDIASLQESERQLSSGAQRREAALAEADQRAEDLGILSGRLPAQGPGLVVAFYSAGESVKASALLNAVEELRGAGAEAMQIADDDGTAVRIIASTYFKDSGAGVEVDGRHLRAPYTITVIGDATTMSTALNIPGGVVASVSKDGGTVTVQQREVVDVTALSEERTLQYARPVS